MMGAKAAILLGIVCFAAYASAQDIPDDFAAAPLAAAPIATESGSYLVNGTGVVYDSSSVTFFLNGTSVGSVPNPHAPGPANFDPHSDHDDKSKDDKKDLPKPDLKKKDPPTPSPQASDEMFEDILDKIKDSPNPLYNVVIGRRMMH